MKLNYHELDEYMSGFTFLDTDYSSGELRFIFTGPVIGEDIEKKLEDAEVSNADMNKVYDKCNKLLHKLDSLSKNLVIKTKKGSYKVEIYSDYYETLSKDEGIRVEVGIAIEGKESQIENDTVDIFNDEKLWHAVDTIGDQVWDVSNKVEDYIEDFIGYYEV